MKISQGSTLLQITQIDGFDNLGLRWLLTILGLDLLLRFEISCCLKQPDVGKKGVDLNRLKDIK